MCKDVKIWKKSQSLFILHWLYSISLNKVDVNNKLHSEWKMRNVNFALYLFKKIQLWLYYCYYLYQFGSVSRLKEVKKELAFSNSSSFLLSIHIIRYYSLTSIWFSTNIINSFHQIFLFTNLLLFLKIHRW